MEVSPPTATGRLSYSTRVQPHKEVYVMNDQWTVARIAENHLLRLNFQRGSWSLQLAHPNESI